MSIITVPGPLSGKAYQVKIAGDTPTMDEQLRIDAFVRQQEAGFKTEYEQFYGQPLAYEDSWEPLEQAGEFFKGIGSGAVGLLESGLLGATASLPEQLEAPAREAIRSGAYALKPQADIGREDSVAGKLGSGFGSLLALGVATRINPRAGQLLAGASGAGESSERAYAAGATEDERTMAALLGLVPGTFDYLPVARMLSRFGVENVKGVKASLGRILMQGGEEALQEAAQEIAQNMIAQGVYDPEQDLVEGVGDAAALGGSVGALAQTLIELVLPGKTPSAPAPAPATNGPTTPSTTPPAAAPSAPPAQPPAEGGGTQYDDENLIPLPFANLAAPVRSGTPEFENLTEARKAQEEAYGKALDLGGGLIPQVMKLAAAGKSVAEVAKELGRTINSVAAGEKDLSKRAAMRNAFVQQVFTRIGIPSDTESPEFAKWVEQYKAFTGPTRKVPKPPTAPLEVKQAAEAKKDKAEAIATSPEVAAETAALGATKPTEPTTPKTPAARKQPPAQKTSTASTQETSSAVADVQTFTPEFVTGVLGFSKGSSLAKAAKNGAALSGKPVTDPAVQARLRTLLGNSFVDQEKRAAIRSVLGEAPTPAPDAEAPAPAPVAEAPAPAPVAEAPAPAPVAEAPAPAPVAEAPAPAPVAEAPAPAPASVAYYNPMTGAIPGQPGGLPGQPVPAPKAVLQKRAAALEDEGVALPKIKVPARPDAPDEDAPLPTRRLAVPTDEASLRAAERELVDASRARDSVNNRELGDTLAEEVRKGLSPTDIDFLGLTEAVSVRPDVTLAGDKRAILALLRRGGASTPETKAARVFFSKFPNPTEALEEIGAQSILAVGQIQGKGVNSDSALRFYKGMGKQAALKAKSWVEDNLSAAAKSSLAKAEADAFNDKLKIHVRGEKGNDPVEVARKREEAEAALLNKVLSEAETDAAVQKQREQVRAVVAEAKLRAPTNLPEALTRPLPSIPAPERGKKSPFLEWLEGWFSKADIAEMSAEERRSQYERYVVEKAQGFALRTDAVTALDRPVLPSVRRLISFGQTRRVFEAIAANAETSGVARIARALAKNMGSTKIELVTGMTNEMGDQVSGLFDPKTNTIYIDAADGLNVHTILHEGVHAVVSATLDRPGHPLTQQLRALFERVKPAIGAAYGTTDLQEFAAELLSNSEFQAKLAQLTVRGQRITALDRAMHAVRNFVRRLMGLGHVPMGTALTRGDQIIEGLMAPAPESRNAGVMYSAQTKRQAAKIVGNALNNGPSATTQRLQMLSDAVSDSSAGAQSMVKEALLRLTPLHYLVKVTEPYFPGTSARLNELVNASSGELARVRDTIQNMSAKVGRWASANGNKIDTLNSLINNSTLHQVDPELTPEDAAKAFGNDTERMSQWRMVKAEWDAVGPSGQEQYRTLRNAFRSLRADLLKVMDIRLEAAVPDKEIRRRLRDDLHDKILGKKDRTIEPYFPLGRRGDYWLSYNAIDHRTDKFEFFVEAFESPSERRRYIEELKADPSRGAGEFREMPRRDAVDFTQAPPLSFMGALHKNLTRRGVDPSVIKTIAQVYLDTVPETSYLQAFRQRKGTLGFNHDAMRTAVERAGGLARSIVQLKYGTQLAALKSEINQQAKELASAGLYTDAVAQMRDQLDAFADFAASPERPRWAQIATTATFNLTLGFNVSTALLNLMQTPMILLPTIGGRYGWRQSTKAIGAAMRAMSGSPHTREIEVYGADGVTKTKQRIAAAPSLENYDFDDPSLPSEIRELRHLVEVGRDNGQFNRSIAYDILDVDSRLPSESKVRATLDKAQAAAGWMLHQTERLNRETAMAATYRLELDRIRAKEGRAPTEAEMRDAAKQAIYITEMTNGGIAMAATPRFAQSGIGQVVFMYKRYGVSMYALLFDTAKRALRNSDPADRAIAIKQIVGIAGMSGLLSGVAGLPMFGTIAMLYNLLLADDEDKEFGMVVREAVGDGPYRGVINALLGVNVASRIELSNLLFRESLIEKEQAALWSLLESLGGPVIGTYLNIERGITKMSEGEIYDGFAAVAPAPVRYVMRALEYGSEGVLTRTGDKIVDDLHPGHVLAQALGFAPAELAMQQEINSARKKFEKAVVARRSKLTERYAMAVRENNREALREVMQDIAEYNADHPYWQVTADTLRRSMDSRDKTDERTFNGVSYNAKLVEPALAFAKDYGG